jgi:hypothetical protein
VYYLAWTTLAAAMMLPGVVWSCWIKQMSCWRARTAARIRSFLGQTRNPKAKSKKMQ